MKTKNANALIAVLGLIFAASIIAVSLVEYTTRAVRVSASSTWERDLRLDAYSALYASVAVLKEYEKIDGGLFSAERGWGEPLKDGRITFPDGSLVTVKITDESGKLPLSALDSSSLQKIFEEMDIPASDAQEMADCIVDWRDADDGKSFSGAEYEDYDTNAVKPPNRHISSLDELKYVKKVQEVFFDENGNPNDLFKTFASGVSTELFEKTNLNSASPATLKMMLDIEAKDYDDSLYSALRGESGQVSDGIVWVKNATELSSRGATEIPVRNAVYKSRLLKIEITVKRGVGEYYLCAFYADADTAKYYEENVKKVYEASENAKLGKKADSSAGVVMPSVYSSNSTVSSDNKTYVILKLFERGNNQ